MAKGKKFYSETEERAMLSLCPESPAERPVTTAASAKDGYGQTLQEGNRVQVFLDGSPIPGVVKEVYNDREVEIEFCLGSGVRRSRRVNLATNFVGRTF